jgi:hypothetical protein
MAIIPQELPPSQLSLERFYDFEAFNTLKPLGPLLTASLRSKEYQYNAHL